MYVDALMAAEDAPSRARQAAALVAVLALLLLSQGGALRADRRSDGWVAGRPELQSAVAHHVDSGIDVDAVIEQARHTVAPVPGDAGTLEVSSGDYRLTFQNSGFTYRPTAAAGSLAIGTESLVRGGQRIGFDVGRWTARGDMAGRDLAPAVREQVTARSGEVEWDVVLAAEPTGHGDLVLRADIDGVVGKPEVLAGGRTMRLVLTDGATVDVGETVVVDASGRVLHRALPAISDGRVEIVVPDTVLKRAAYPVTIDPTVSSGKQVTSAFAQQPSIAFDGEDYLVAWTEYDGSNYEVRAAQVNGGGTLVQPIGFLSTQGDSKDDRRPAVAWNGARFLVAWEHAFSASDIDVFGRLVTKAGFPLGPEFQIVAPIGNQTGPSVATVGTTFYAVWSDDRTGAGDIRGRRVTNAGAVLDGTVGITLTTAANAETQPDIVATSGALLVSYQYLVAAGNPDVYAQRADLSLQPIGVPIPLATSGAPEQDAKVASNGSAYLVVWGGPGDIQGRRILPNGSLPDGAPIPIATGGDKALPDVAFNGAYLVAWKDNRNFWNEIWAARVASAGTVQDPTGFRVFDQASSEGTGAIQAPPALAPAPGGNRWAIDHEVIFGGIYHYTASK